MEESQVLEAWVTSLSGLDDGRKMSQIKSIENILHSIQTRVQTKIKAENSEIESIQDRLHRIHFGGETEPASDRTQGSTISDNMDKFRRVFVRQRHNVLNLHTNWRTQGSLRRSEESNRKEEEKRESGEGANTKRKESEKRVSGKIKSDESDISNERGGEEEKKQGSVVYEDTSKRVSREAAGFLKNIAQTAVEFCKRQSRLQRDRLAKEIYFLQENSEEDPHKTCMCEFQREMTDDVVPLLIKKFEEKHVHGVNIPRGVDTEELSKYIKLLIELCWSLSTDNSYTEWKIVWSVEEVQGVRNRSRDRCLEGATGNIDGTFLFQYFKKDSKENDVWKPALITLTEGGEYSVKEKGCVNHTGKTK